MIKLEEITKNIIQIGVFKNDKLIDAWDISASKMKWEHIMRMIGERYLDKEYKIFITFISNRNISTYVH